MIFVILLFINLLKKIFCKENIYYKKNLRDLYEKETIKIIQEIIDNKYKIIYENIINTAKYGLNESKFTIFCEKEIGSQLPEHIQKHMFNILPKENFTTKILDKIKETFPDSTINKVEKKYDPNIDGHYGKCNEYTLSW